MIKIITKCRKMMKRVKKTQCSRTLCSTHLGCSGNRLLGTLLNISSHISAPEPLHVGYTSEKDSSKTKVYYIIFLQLIFYMYGLDSPWSSSQSGWFLFFFQLGMVGVSNFDQENSGEDFINLVSVFFLTLFRDLFKRQSENQISLFS